MSSTLLHCSSITTAARSGALNLLPYLRTPPRRNRKGLSVTAASISDSSDNTSPQPKSLFSVIFDAPRSIWRETLRPLSDAGFGRKSVWEGSVGLFVVSGTVLFVLSLAWLRSFQHRSKFRKYSAIFQFDHACGICIGTPVRIRGVNVGNVVRVNPSLRSIEVVVEVEDDRVIIPRNSLVEVNQSGLLMETRIDITPRNPILTTSVGPLDAGCGEEGLIVCDREKLEGQRGVSLDEMVGIYTHFGRAVEEIGVANMYSLAERVAAVVEEARPLLRKVEAMADDIEPLLAEIHDGGLLQEVDNLTKSLTRAEDDLRRMHSSILTPENTQLIQKSIQTLVSTLKNIENICSDILGFTGDKATKKNLKQLINSLSRLF